MDAKSSPGDGFAGRVEVVGGARRRRRWPDDVKARIVAESYEPGVQVADVARRHGVTPQQLTGWRRAAKDGLLAASQVPATGAEAPTGAAFVPLEVADATPAPSSADNADRRIEVSVGRVEVRVPADSEPERIAAVAAALEARL
jgi:transposase